MRSTHEFGGEWLTTSVCPDERAGQDAGLWSKNRLVTSMDAVGGGGSIMDEEVCLDEEARERGALSFISILLWCMVDCVMASTNPMTLPTLSACLSARCWNCCSFCTAAQSR
mmetsp:Transcript_35516/g.91326  ORF Transcript_35516/g.91326 Transcript_35516/m.91326 type:complete len:112 (-) Transcript_35516:949-1284(-)